MVAVLLRLRFRVLGNTLRRNTFQLVSVIVGGAFGVLLVPWVFNLLLVTSTAPPETRQLVVVAGGSALIAGWCVVPLLFDGVDRTVDPLRLARFPIGTATIMTTMMLVGLLWLPGAVTTIVSLSTAAAWLGHQGAMAAALLSGVLGTLICVAASRLTTSIAGTLLSGRGAARAGVAVVALVLLAGPALFVLLGESTLSGEGLAAAFVTAVGTLGWTPLGAVWSIPGRLATGDTAGAGLAALIALATLAGILLLWRWSIGVGLRARGEGPSGTAAAGRLGPFGWLPSTPTGAIAARSLVYWFKDARQARQLVLIPLMPTLLLLWWQLFDIDWITVAIGPLVASLLPLSAFAAISYDGTAFAAQLAAGVRGLHDRVGRAIALLIIVVPSTVAVQIIVAGITGRQGELPALLGLSMGTLLISLGVVSVSSARVVVPLARAGRNPFSAQPGAATVSIAASYAVAAVTGVLMLPVVAVVVIALLSGSAALGWAALAAGLLAGGGVLAGGLVLGGRMLDSGAPAVLARLRLIRG